MSVKSDTRPPYTRAHFARRSSRASGFFFCGIMLEPVQRDSSMSKKPNSSVHHKIHSSASLDTCMASMDRHEANSIQKSLSPVASTLLVQMDWNPRIFAVMAGSIGSVVPASAQAPRGDLLTRLRQSASLSL